MHRLVVVLALAAAWGCGDKKPPAASGDLGVGSSGFVEIEIDEEDSLDELIGSELMVATARCGDLVRLEPSAMMGKLNDGEIRCLDQSLREAEKQTIKDKISRVLMADAWAKGDQHRWEGIVRLHLSEIDQSDPDLNYKFAKYLTSRGPEYADEVMKWTNVALENRSHWVGDTHVSRVYNLYKIKAFAAQQKWDTLEADYLKAPSEEALQAKTDARNMAKTLAREWLEYARQSGKDPTVAMQLCVSAAGTEEFCENM